MNAHVAMDIGTGWTPAAWRDRPAAQMPLYPDQESLRVAEAQLRAMRPLATPEACRALQDRLAAVGRGAGFLLQGGECAESFAGFSAARVQATTALLAAIAAMLPAPVTVTARLAGQFAKPRSADHETRDGLTLPAYRGDSINDFAFDAQARQPDPARMVRAYEQARETVSLLPPDYYTCHEALLLPYEEALTRRDGESGAWYAASASFLWLGARTQEPDGAHVAYLRGIANPVGIKCAPWTKADDLLRLCDVLDPHNSAGRLTLIPRMGAAAIDDHLPALIRAIKRAGRHVTWCCDPMHGNTIVTATGRKTRRFADIATELARYVAIHRDEGTWAGGVHLEVAGDDVTECIGGNGPPDESGLARRYETRCDPRLNPAQADELARYIASMLPVRPAAV